MTTKDGELLCDKCGRKVEQLSSVNIGDIMSFDLCGRCERDLEIIVLDFMHGVKE
jgi:DNA-directed RNA polymerase subunit RPC12/RpoP